MTAGAATREWRSFATRVAVLFAAFCVVLGITTPYLPVWLDWVGLSAREIASMCTSAGFHDVTHHSVPGTPQTVTIAVN